MATATAKQKYQAEMQWQAEWRQGCSDGFNRRARNKNFGPKSAYMKGFRVGTAERIEISQMRQIEKCWA